MIYGDALILFVLTAVDDRACFETVNQNLTLDDYLMIVCYMSFKKDVEVANRPDGVVWK